MQQDLARAERRSCVNVSAHEVPQASKTRWADSVDLGLQHAPGLQRRIGPVRIEEVSSEVSASAAAANRGLLCSGPRSSTDHRVGKATLLGAGQSPEPRADPVTPSPRMPLESHTRPEGSAWASAMRATSRAAEPGLASPTPEVNEQIARSRTRGHCDAPARRGSVRGRSLDDRVTVAVGEFHLPASRR